MTTLQESKHEGRNTLQLEFLFSAWGKECKSESLANLLQNTTADNITFRTIVEEVSSEHEENLSRQKQFIKFAKKRESEVSYYQREYTITSYDRGKDNIKVGERFFSSIKSNILDKFFDEKSSNCGRRIQSDKVIYYSYNISDEDMQGIFTWAKKLGKHEPSQWKGKASQNEVLLGKPAQQQKPGNRKNLAIGGVVLALIVTSAILFFAVEAPIWAGAIIALAIALLFYGVSKCLSSVKVQESEPSVAK